MPSLWFIVPAHGRAQLAQICLTQLRRTCDALTAEGIHATAVVVADDANLDTARSLGFGWVRRDNRYLSSKFNYGIQLACTNPRPADYVVPCGSDDWVDHRLFLDLPARDEIRAFRLAAFVNETGDQIISRVIDYTAGVGIRVYPRQMLEPLQYRPADEDRERGCDTSIFVNVSRAYFDRPPAVVYGDLHEWQIVDWKTRGEQLNTFGTITGRFRRGSRPQNPYEVLAGTFPRVALRDMAQHYRQVREREAVLA